MALASRQRPVAENACAASPEAALTLLSEQVVGENEIHHCLHHRHGSRQHAGIMPTLGGQFCGLTSVIDGLLFLADRRRWLEGDTDHNGFAVADASLNTA